MAIALDQILGTGNSSGVGTTTLTTTAAVAVGGKLIVVVGRFNFTNSTLSVAGGGLSWFEDVTIVQGNVRTSLFRADAPAGLASATALTITHTGGGSADCVAGACSYSGMATGGPSAVNTTGGGTTAAWATGSVGAANGNGMVGGAFIDGSAASSTPTSPAVERIDANIAGQSEVLTLIDKLSVSGTDTLGGTWSNTGTWAAVAVAYAASSTSPSAASSDGGGGVSATTARRIAIATYTG